MKKYRYISEEELIHHGVNRQWDAEVLRTLQPGTSLLWVHTKRQHYTSLSPNDERLIRKINVVKIDEHHITTDFGKYTLDTGKNVHAACGCKRFCDCYGQLFLPITDKEKSCAIL